MLQGLHLGVHCVRKGNASFFDISKLIEGIFIIDKRQVSLSTVNTSSLSICKTLLFFGGVVIAFIACLTSVQILDILKQLFFGNFFITIVGCFIGH